jgi:hypothetical protein
MAAESGIAREEFQADYDPAMTRRLMRREISELCKRVEERGPGD